ncbi:putative serine/threonine protein kinase [Mycobacteroides abscessus subsp. abscessus]|nr:putative serine/threonine protein kinase [Mycobacteroides abscessus subsp. abscessus]
MRTRSGSAVLTDFGIAQELAHADGPRRPVVQTSLPYAAPEVLRGQPVTAATDQYALACTAVELFDGKPPFTALSRYPTCTEFITLLTHAMT